MCLALPKKVPTPSCALSCFESHLAGRLSNWQPAARSKICCDVCARIGSHHQTNALRRRNGVYASHCGVSSICVNSTSVSVPDNREIVIEGRNEGQPPASAVTVEVLPSPKTDQTGHEGGFRTWWTSSSCRALPIPERRPRQGGVLTTPLLLQNSNTLG